MRATTSTLILSATLAGCAGPIAERGATAPVDVRIIAFNDFHGNLEPPGGGVDLPEAAAIPAGGVALMADAVRRLRAGAVNSVVVSAGDLIGASPFISAQFLDEPTIEAMNLVGVDLNAVGNHEFDKGRAELLRMQAGGCARHATRTPCALDGSFDGARFGFLAANVLTEAGKPLFPAYAMKSFGRGASQVRVGFIGMTLKGTPSLVSGAGVAGLRFADEADTANALVPALRAQGADAIVLVIHQGATTVKGFADPGCEGLSGDLLPILDRLDPGVDVVVSGHTHRAYVCDYGRVNPAKPFLLTSAGRYGTLLTTITLRIDPDAGRVAAKRAETVVVRAAAEGRPGFAPDPAVAALVARYAAASAAASARLVGRLSAPATRAPTPAGEQVLGDLIADAQLAATRGAGARIAFMNAGGVRADLQPGPGGVVTFGQLFAAQPFGNRLVTKGFTGRQLRAVLEQQFAEGGEPKPLLPSATLRYSYDPSRPAGARVGAVTIDGAPLRNDETYRVTMSEFLAAGGDGFTAFAAGTDPAAGPLDIDALVAFFGGPAPVAPPTADRIAVTR